MSYEKKRSAYATKLLDPRWQKKRLEILNRDEWACRICFDSKSTLHVHHRRYEYGKEPWDYPDEWLVTLCADCHEAEGPLMREMLESISRDLALKFFASDVLNIAAGINAMRLQHIPEVVSVALEWAFKDADMQKQIIDCYFAAIKKSRNGRPHPLSPEANEDAKP